ncbi:MAG: hypothetical protein RJA70_1502 [Pseudomonadota bacterium]|jgi:GTP pyrophosphokinase
MHSLDETFLSPLVAVYGPEALKLPRAALQVLEQAQASDSERNESMAAAQLLAALRADPTAIAVAILAALPDAVVAALAASGAPRSQETAPRFEFPADVTELVKLVNRLRAIRWNHLEAQAAETLRKTFVAMARDVRVVLIVLALRVAMMRTLPARALSGTAENELLAQETLDIFAPLANRLGIWQFKWELEDLAFQVLEPETYAELKRSLSDSHQKRERFVAEVVQTLQQKLSEAGLQVAVKGRVKHTFSIHEKMRKKRVTFEQLFDVVAVRVITQDVQSCYGALGLVHATWVPVPHEFDDYIAMPKDNGYQSLHTVVMGPRGRPVEIQIRSQEMHRFAEFGVAAHWGYKEGKSAQGVAQDKFMLLRQLLNWEKDLKDPEQFVSSMRTDLFQDQVFVFTPDGDVIDLPKGATPLDFAYRIHTLVGHRCRGALVNDKMVPLDYQLQTGDRVAILKHKQPQPSRDWVNASFGYLRTNSARTKVRLWFREQGRDDAILAGRELLQREFRRMGLSLASVDETVQVLGYKTADEMYAAVGYGDRSVQSVCSAAHAIEQDDSVGGEPEVPTSSPPSQRAAPPSGLSIGNIEDIQGKQARCCRPVPGDKVMGFVTRGRGLIVHRADCPNVLGSSEPERLVSVHWGMSPTAHYAVELLVTADDQPGLMAELLSVAGLHGVKVTSARQEEPAEARGAREVLFRFSFSLRGAEQLSLVTGRLLRHDRVKEVRRVSH